mgnify:CR=1 FL=1
MEHEIYEKKNELQTKSLKKYDVFALSNVDNFFFNGLLNIIIIIIKR